jgi:CheY-like chemotaxis protein
VSLALVPSRYDDPRDQSWADRRASTHVWSLNILLVEDDLADTSLILNVLKRHPDVAAVHAFDAPIAALHQIAEGRQRPDLILLDIHMPRLGGFEFLQGLRRIPTAIAVPVVFLTTSGLGEDVRKYRESSASSYIIKPDTYSELQARMDGVIKRALSGIWSQ